MTDIFGATLALIADIHGNSWALDAVLEDINQRGIDRIVNLGDSLHGPLDPLGTAQRLLTLDFATVRGNGDRTVLEVGEESTDTARYAHGELRPEHLEWLRGLPATIALGPILLCHGTPRSDETYLLEDVTPQATVVAPADVIIERIGDTQGTVIACGHSHVPRAVWLPDGRLVLNVGSVGLPCYTENLPHAHAMESWSPHAKYAVLQQRGAQWQVEHILVPYDWTVAAATARANGRPDWAEWLLQGRV